MTSLGVAATVLGGISRAHWVALAALIALSPSACGGEVDQLYHSEPTSSEAPANGAAGAGGQPGSPTERPSQPLPEVECAAPLALPDPALRECFSSSMNDEGLEPESFEDLRTLSCSEVAMLAGIECLTGLEILYLGPGSVDDLRPLAGLTQLVELSIGDNPVSEVGALAGLTSIRSLLLAQLELEDIGPLSTCGHRINSLWLMYNRIRDIGPLVANRAIGGWTTIWLVDNPLDCGSQAQNLTTLRERQATVYNDCGDYWPLGGVVSPGPGAY
jgi:hypothetical protein